MSQHALDRVSDSGGEMVADDFATVAPRLEEFLNVPALLLAVTAL